MVDAALELEPVAPLEPLEVLEVLEVFEALEALEALELDGLPPAPPEDDALPVLEPDDDPLGEPPPTPLEDDDEPPPDPEDDATEELLAPGALLELDATSAVVWPPPEPVLLLPHAMGAAESATTTKPSKHRAKPRMLILGIVPPARAPLALTCRV